MPEAQPKSGGGLVAVVLAGFSAGLVPLMRHAGRGLDDVADIGASARRGVSAPHGLPDEAMLTRLGDDAEEGKSLVMDPDGTWRSPDGTFRFSDGGLHFSDGAEQIIDQIDLPSDESSTEPGQSNDGGSSQRIIAAPQTPAAIQPQRLTPE